MKFENLLQLFEQTQTEMRRQAARSVDIALVVRNWLFGWYIVEFENAGAERIDLYGKQLMKNLADKLTSRLGKGFSKRSLELYRLFFMNYKEITQTVSAQSLSLINHCIQDSLPIAPISFKPEELMKYFKLGWSHYVTLITIRNSEERRFYEIEAIENNWSVRELQRQLESSLYERLALSRDKRKIKELSEKGQVVGFAEDIIKNPYILEFLNLPEHPHYSKHELETAIIDKIEHFLLELGKGFLFEARQKRFTLDDDHFYVDLVFYNRLLRCYVLIDLKKDKLTHQDLGQMQMYVNYFDRFVKKDYENPTIGILLCHRKNDALVELTLPEKSNIRASEYQLYLPSKDELKKQLEDIQKDLTEEKKHDATS
ncbi:MAG TPA: DUF1016 domain-containing protein [Lentisphaeria bacterium]|nr:MAG: hypothetical protein A2X47_02800 [Lentisphaerae bacterium GWF2_38_69]HBM15388.1 DUF1016 domain-containing protein [Lentisphaeria bacterium]